MHTMGLDSSIYLSASLSPSSSLVAKGNSFFSPSCAPFFGDLSPTISRITYKKLTFSGSFSEPLFADLRKDQQQQHPPVQLHRHTTVLCLSHSFPPEKAPNAGGGGEATNQGGNLWDSLSLGT